MATVDLQDSRRLTGPNLISDRAGAVLDARIAGVATSDLLAAWHLRARQILTAVGWDSEGTRSREYSGGVSVFISAPIDALYAATEINEWAWSAARSDVGVGPPAEPHPLATERLLKLIGDERNPALLALRDAALSQGVAFLADDEHVSVGLGTGSLTWTVSGLPTPDRVEWDRVHDVPRVLITGTNGKTTTVRMVAAILRIGGRATGFTCTDGLYVDGSLIDGGDWSGPGGARAILRDPRVEVAILETARGGLLRRGLGVGTAQAALVTNVAEDHLGEWGVGTVEDVARAKLVVARAVEHGAPLIINADDPILASAAIDLDRPITWTSLRGDAQVARPGEVVWFLQDGWIHRGLKQGRPTGTRIVEVASIPAALGGAALYNVSNAMNAAAISHALGTDDANIAKGLRHFDPSPEQSPGRSNLFTIAGVRILVDFVHNPHGFAAVGTLVAGLAPKRLGLMIGHAGDRDDEAIRDIARAGWALGPHRVAVKELSHYLRGREPGEVPNMIRRALLDLGAIPSSTTVHGDELSATRALLEWARPGDLLLLSTHEQRAAVLDLVETLRREGWAPGKPVPSPPIPTA